MPAWPSPTAWAGPWSSPGPGRTAPSFWELEDPPPLTVLRYRVKPYDPDRSPEASFADRRRFVALGYSMFIMPEEVRQFETLPIRVTLDAPEGWPTWASWPGGPGRWMPRTPHDLWSGVAAGGSFHPSRMGNESVAVTVLTESGISGIMGTTIANRLLPVLREMHDLFGASPRGETLRVLALYRTQTPRKRLEPHERKQRGGGVSLSGHPGPLSGRGPAHPPGRSRVHALLSGRAR